MKRPDERAVLLVFGAIAALSLLIVPFAMTRGEDGDNGASGGPEAAKLHSAPEGRTMADPPTRKPIPTIVVSGGEPRGGISELTARAGQTVRFRVRSDVSDEVHVHGYDISKPVRAGASATFAFPADLEGIFEIELERSAVPLAELRVEP